MAGKPGAVSPRSGVAVRGGSSASSVDGSASGGSHTSCAGGPWPRSRSTTTSSTEGVPAPRGTDGPCGPITAGGPPAGACPLPSSTAPGSTQPAVKGRGRISRGTGDGSGAARSAARYGADTYPALNRVIVDDSTLR